MTSVDVLQILETKLCLVFPIEDVKVIIEDQAEKDGIAISPFNILRGRDAIYEKYGYENDNLTGLKEKLKSFTWSDCNRQMKSIIADCTGKSDWSDDTLLITIMNTISWDDEKKYNAIKRLQGDKPLSHYVFDQFAERVGYVLFERTETGPYIHRPIWTFKLDRDSSAWRRCNSELLFTEFTPDTAGGRRTIKGTKNKSKKTRKRRRNERI